MQKQHYNISTYKTITFNIKKFLIHVFQLFVAQNSIEINFSNILREKFNKLNNNTQ